MCRCLAYCVKYLNLYNTERGFLPWILTRNFIQFRSSSSVYLRGLITFVYWLEKLFARTYTLYTAVDGSMDTRYYKVEMFYSTREMETTSLNTGFGNIDKKLLVVRSNKQSLQNLKTWKKEETVSDFFLGCKHFNLKRFGLSIQLETETFSNSTYPHCS